MDVRGDSLPLRTRVLPTFIWRNVFWRFSCLLGFEGYMYLQEKAQSDEIRRVCVCVCWHVRSIPGVTVTGGRCEGQKFDFVREVKGCGGKDH